VGETTGNNYDDKSSQNAFFSPPFCACLAEGDKGLHGSVPSEPTSPCKISPQSVPVGLPELFPRTMISCEHDICVRRIIRPQIMIIQLNTVFLVLIRHSRSGAKAEIGGGCFYFPFPYPPLPSPFPVLPLSCPFRPFPSP